MRVERELLRGAGPITVLRLLSHQEMYGYQLVQALARQTDGVLAMGHSTLYPLLYGLVAKGLIKGTWRTAPSGRRRKYYSVTTKSAAYLKSRRAQWRRLVDTLGQLGLLEPGR